MLYIERNRDGRLLRVEAEPFEGMTGTMLADSEEAQDWLAASNDEHAQRVGLQASDLEMVRVLEDLIGVLIERGVIRFTDLPAAAQRKLRAREQKRARLGGLMGLLGDDDEPRLL
ncbi:tryptophan synthase subunit beta [Pseudomonas oligotrophica]|uniref:tryptophan synthase subunit beta n=1 Tax=Pseudomonas oligotrophica TaxID=2912055 RepID=UPI001F332B96|nr:tryptophan synthase subunit beta [Pseudomonas oligotrophica]MCF7204054.1 tryptophan synthase subunit beta [Pseudomonas oligotrophica]